MHVSCFNGFLCSSSSSANIGCGRRIMSQIRAWFNVGVNAFTAVPATANMCDGRATISGISFIDPPLTLGYKTRGANNVSDSIYIPILESRLFVFIDPVWYSHYSPSTRREVVGAKALCRLMRVGTTVHSTARCLEVLQAGGDGQFCRSCGL